MTRSPEDVIVRPYITEKSNNDIALGKYTFIVSVGSTKTEIRQAVETLFNVRVLKVNTMNCEGKLKRVRLQTGRRPNWKKAIVKIDTDPKPETYLGKGGKEITSPRKRKGAIEEFGMVQ
ncbi:MAG: 50S ribosomal protein L23 [Oscillospiraceae bacterium]|nr:50S ribosomal protein L23 [Oscillospiraceae bacterium]